MKRTLILGIGNTIRGDDAVGIEAIRRLREQTDIRDVDIEETSEAGFNLLSMMTGYDWAIIVDSIQTKGGRTGEIYRFTHRDLDWPESVQCSHNTGIPAVLEWADKMSVPLPQEIIFYMVEITKNDIFYEGLTKPIRDVIPKVVGMIKAEIDH
ncbi:MAG: hydrogenase maturation protease [bacterium]